MFSVHTTPEEFENRGFTLKTQQIFSVHTTIEEFKNDGNNHRSYLICGCEKIAQGNHMIIAFERPRFQNASCPHQDGKSAFSNSSGLKSVFEKLRVRDGLVWTVGLTVDIKLRFQIPPE